MVRGFYTVSVVGIEGEVDIKAVFQVEVSTYSNIISKVLKDEERRERVMTKDRVLLFLSKVVVIFPLPRNERVDVDDRDRSTKFNITKSMTIPLSLCDGATKGKEIDKGFEVTAKVALGRVQGSLEQER